MMPDQHLRIKITADGEVDFTVMFEPSGMTYALRRSEHMFADIPTIDVAEMEIVCWKGGISIWAPGAVITLDSSGTELHRLN
jgi:hypothetical protein